MPLPEAAGPSMAMTTSSRPSRSSRAERRSSASTKPGKLVSMVAPSSMRDRLLAPPCPAPGRPWRCDGRAAVAIAAPPAGGRAGAVDDQAVALDRDRDAAGGEARRRSRASRSLSLTRSSARPCITRAALGEGGGDGEDRIFVDHRRRALGRHVDALAARPARTRDRRPARRPRSRRFSIVDVGAHFDQRLEQAGAQRVEADAVDRDVASPARSAPPPAGNAAEDGSPGTVDRRGRELRLAGDGDARARPSPSRRPRPRRRNGAACARCGRASAPARSPGLARRVEAGEQHRRLHLRRGTGRR